MIRRDGALFIILVLLSSPTRPLSAFVAPPSPKSLPWLYYSTDGVGNQVKSSSGDTHSEEELLKFYRTVAEQDPEWYSNFVVNVLGEETVKQNRLPLKIDPTQKKKLETETTQVSTNASKVVEEKVVETSIKTTLELDRKTLEDQSPKPQIVETKDATDKIAPSVSEKTGSDLDHVVAYLDGDNKMQTVPLANLTSLGYTSDDVILLQSDVVALVVTDRVRKPQGGVPQQWQAPVASKNQDSEKTQPSFRVQIVSTAKAEILRREVAAKLERQKQQHLKNKQQETQSSTLDLTASDLTNTTSADSVPLIEKPTISKVEANATSPRHPPTSSSSFSQNVSVTAGDEKMVQYQPSDSRTHLAVPLSNLTALGYSAEDILRLQPDVVSLILMDRVIKPRTGVPPHWQSPVVANGSIVEQINITPGSEGQRLEKTKPVKNVAKENQNDQSEADKALDSTPKATLAKEEQSPPKPVASGTPPDAEAESQEVGNMDEEVVVYRDVSSDAIRQTPLKTFTALGYGKEEMVALQPDVISVIVADDVRKPRAGIPPQWKAAGDTTGEVSSDGVQILKQSAVDAIIANDQKSRKQASAKTDTPTDPPKEDSQVSKRTSKHTEGVKSTGTREDIQTNSQKGRPSNKEKPKTPASEPDAAEHPTGWPDFAQAEKSIENVVVYRDSSKSGPQLVSLESLTSLGYGLDEIKQLRSDVVALILSDNMSRPRGTLPSQWRSTKTRDGLRSDGVQVMSAEEAEALVKRAKTRPRSRKSWPRSGTNGKDRDVSGPRAGERRVARTRGADGKRKKIYNGRRNFPKKVGRAGDPPPPKSFFWMDVDTFRGLIRKEAELRLRILGNDFAGFVKDESDWRLGLYKDWLWTLENGIGNPIVPERTRRGRRSRQVSTKPDSQSARSSRSSKSPRPRRGS